MDSQFKHIGIFIRPQTPHIPEVVGKLLPLLLANGIEVFFDADTAVELTALPQADAAKIIDKSQFGRHCDLVLVLGGDGTLLAAARELAPFRVPIIGIHRGRLGFLTQVSWENTVSDVSEMLTGKFLSEERILLESTVMRSNTPIQTSLALNDVVFSRGGMGQMIEFEVFINGEFVYTQRSDGLIVSTPTGSTAYSLAAGGPILQPTLRALTLVPICPQSLSNRPVAVSDSSEIEVLITRGVDARVHFDGQIYLDLNTMDRIKIHRYHNNLRMLHPIDYRYFKTLRQKLHWGEQLV